MDSPSTENILLTDIQPIARTTTTTTTTSIPSTYPTTNLTTTPSPEQIISTQIHTPPSTATLLTILRSATPTQKCILLFSTLCAVVAGAAMPVVTVITGTLAGEFIDGEDKSPGEVRERVRRLTGWLVVVAITSLLTTLLTTHLTNTLSHALTHTLKAKFLASTLRQNPAFFDLHATSTLTTTLHHDTSLIQTGLSQKLSDLVSGISGFLVALGIAFSRNARFAGVVVAQPVGLLVVVGVLGGVLGRLQKARGKGVERAEGLVLGVLGGLRGVKAGRGEGRFAGKYRALVGDMADGERRERTLFGGVVGGAFLVWGWGCGLGFWQADSLYRQGRCTIPEALTIMYAVSVAGGMLVQVLPNVVDVLQANGAAGRVYAVIDRVSPIDPSEKTGKVYDRIGGEIRFEDVSFAYPTRPERRALDKVSFRVPVGHIVALVGPSGSGKSTVFSLLERLYLPLGGRVLMDGEPIDEMNVAWLRSQIGYVGQDVTLFRASIHENIAYGLSRAVTEVGGCYSFSRLDRDAIRELVIQAGQTAQIHSFVMELPQGYDTVIGANGSGLSGGQRQRIAIARAVISQPPILLLDEATAALDSQCEKDVQEALSRAASGRTTMVIAHRLSTIKNADTIMVMKDGRILDQGSHAELMTTCAMYQELVRQQALRPVDQTNGLASEPPWIAETKDPSMEVSSIRKTGAPLSNPSQNNIKQVWRLNQPEMSYILAGIMFSIVAGMAFPIQAIFFGNGIMSIISPDLTTGGHGAHFWSLMYLMHGVVVLTVYCVRGYCFAVSASQLTLRARTRLFDALLQKSLPFFEDKDHSPGALASFLSSGIPKTTGVSGTSLGLVAESLVMLATGIVVGCIFGWKLGLVATATIPFVAGSGFLQYYIAAQVHKYVRRDTDAVAITHEAFCAIRTVTVLNLQRTILESFQRQSLQDRKNGYWLKSAIFYACTTSFRILSIAFVFWYGGTHLIATGEYTIQQFFICFAATVWGSQSAAALFAQAPDIAGAHAAAARLEELMQNDPYPQQHQPATTVSWPSTIEELALRHVDFRYPTDPSRLTLNDVSLHAPAGAFIALVGATGSGKSSVINLLERFYAVDSGQITLGSKSIEEFDLDSYRGYLALVDQNPCLVGEDLRECLHSDERAISDDAILVALKSVGLADYVLSLPQGLSTPVVSNGSTLSGGQHQRMAIAKALLGKPNILLLDEATSALDTASEQVVQEALHHAMQGRTIIAVAHRLKTVVDADEILVFDRGRIIERGTHDALMRLEGRYWQMAQLQQLEGL
ncbi:putative ATP-binding cassette transporter [Aspergillus ellipticus CBS 707.79]|uniref:Putative ATP-binding cassette transporter n=1 Tax=Aspergillus ellipticus CBS 707.79 TaxID=1448320 RepID=A0A319DGK9_9EURO|nr:putative ATP-binding cassette transporter [Aspergillus ellipticus CBS 707.79]